MSRSPPDRPNVVILPPLIPLAALVLALLLQWQVPLGLLAPVPRTWRLAAGGSLIVAGLAIALVGVQALLRRGTHVNPLRPAVALATDGIYRWTRNPIYVGELPLMVGLAIVCALDWLPLLLVPAAMLLHFGVVRREEQYLEKKFGDGYRRYKARVPRYLGRPAAPGPAGRPWPVPRLASTAIRRHSPPAGAPRAGIAVQSEEFSMSFSMSNASLPVFAIVLDALSGLLDKAEAFAAAKKFDSSVLLGWRVAPDMFPFVRQVQIVTDQAKNGAARLADVTPPRYEDTEKTIAELRERVAKTAAFLKTIDPTAIDGAADRAITFPLGPNHKGHMNGADYLNHFVLPNLYFHLTTAYAILRGCGVEIGKQDFLGKIPLTRS